MSSPNPVGESLRLLYAQTADDMANDLRSGAARLSAMLEQLRISEPGAADRAEHLGRHLGGLERQACRLSARLRDTVGGPP